VALRGSTESHLEKLIRWSRLTCVRIDLTKWLSQKYVWKYNKYKYCLRHCCCTRKTVTWTISNVTYLIWSHCLIHIAMTYSHVYVLNYRFVDIRISFYVLYCLILISFFFYQTKLYNTTYYYSSCIMKLLF